MREKIINSLDTAFYPWALLSGKECGVRILMYHLITRSPKPEEKAQVTISLDGFREQLTLIKNAGLQVITLRQALGILEKAPRSGRYLALTFDDFFRDTVEYAAPLLEEFGFPACFFIVTDYLDSNKPMPWLENPELYPLAGTRKMAKELSERGFEIGSHTCTHPRLNRLGREEVRRELSDSRKILEDLIGKKMEFFAYPFGDDSTTDPEIQKLIAESGYKIGLMNITGINRDLKNPYYMFRTHISEYDRGKQLLRKLKGANDWYLFWQKFRTPKQ